MRERLNENPVAQIALIAVLALVAGYLVLTNMAGGSSSSAASETSSVESAAPASATAGVAAPVARPLPHKVEAAYKHGKTLMLFVYRAGGIDDAGTAAAIAAVHSMPNVAFFQVSTKAIARYSAITGPLGVNRAPALIVVSAHKKGDDEPAAATVDYGFLTSTEVRQAVIDARYAGGEPSYAPR
jgi:hypothetical protein